MELFGCRPRFSTVLHPERNSWMDVPNSSNNTLPVINSDKTGMNLPNNKTDPAKLEHLCADKKLGFVTVYVSSDPTATNGTLAWHNCFFAC